MPTGVFIRTDELRLRISNTLKGHSISELTKQKISDSQKGIPKSKESCEKMRIAKLGKRGEETAMFGKHHSTETKNKIRKSRIGKCSGENHPMFGISLSEETKEKLRQANLGKHPSEETRIKLRNRVHSEETRKKIGEKSKGRTLSEDARGRISIAQSGENNSMAGRVGELHPNWNGGISYAPYCPKFNSKRKNATRDFFRGYCIVTGEHQNDCLIKHSVHHIDHDKNQGCDGKPFNLVPMVRSHNSKETHNKEEYKVYINKTLEEGFKWGIWNREEYMEKVMY
jgi:hypothetical protein